MCHIQRPIVLKRDKVVICHRFTEATVREHPLFVRVKRCNRVLGSLKRPIPPAEDGIEHPAESEQPCFLRPKDHSHHSLVIGASSLPPGYARLRCRARWLASLPLCRRKMFAVNKERSCNAALLAWFHARLPILQYDQGDSFRTTISSCTCGFIVNAGNVSLALAAINWNPCGRWATLA